MHFDFENSGSISAALTATVDMVHDVIRRNEKHYLEVKSLEIKFLNEHFSTDLYSKKLSPLTNDLVNRVLNADWRCLIKELQTDMENYAACLIRSIVELIVDKISIQDFFQK